jgi:hypothetical protein
MSITDDETRNDDINFDDNGMIIETEPKKKRPGRPRKTPIRQPQPKKGVVSTPSDTRMFMEFLYDKPLVFKKIWQFFKLMAVSKIHMTFTKEYILIWCIDHYKKSKIQIKINCKDVTHYYCENELDINLSNKNPELIMTTIDRTYNSILMLSTKNNVQNDIQIILKNDMEIDELHRIILLGDNEILDYGSLFNDEDYTIKFKLPGKYFKKMITDIRTFSDIITIKQDSCADPLMFEYIKTDKHIKSLNTAQKSENINLVSKLKDDETFRMSFTIDYVKPISSALLADQIEIFADEDKPLMFVIKMDNNTIEMRILTEIIDNREISQSN